MRILGIRTDGTVALSVAGLAILLSEDNRKSRPMDQREMDALGPWDAVDVQPFELRHDLQKRLDKARLAETGSFHLGGQGSGNFGHAGRIGEVGGSAPGDGTGGGPSDAEKRRQHDEARAIEDAYLHGQSPLSVGAVLDHKNQTEAAKSAMPDVKGKSLSHIASVIRRDWKKVNYAAKPYLDALGSLDKISDNYGMDSGHSIVAYFLGNARSWTGPVAKHVKAELNARLKGK
jgi:hypothetical protein